LDQINPIISHNKVGLGSLVITEQNRFYISISAGKLEVDGDFFIAYFSTIPNRKTINESSS